MSAETTYKKTGSFFGQCFSTAASLLKVLFRSRLGVRLPIATGESCIVLGNGPSLKSSLAKHPETFKKHALFCVNSFSVTEEYTLYQPQYYVILDYGFWMSDGKIILDTVEALRTKTTWKMHLFIPRMASKSKRFKELCKTNKNIQLHYFNYTVFNGFSSVGNWLYSKNLAMPQSQNVLVAAIFLAINSSFKKVIVVGADHTWHENMHLDDNNMLSLKHVHFYDNEEKVTHIPFKKGIHLEETFKVHEIFATWAKTFYGYIALEKYARYKNCKIENASEVTFIDASERKKL